MSIKHELQHIIQGTGGYGKTNIIQQISGYLRASKEAGTADERKKYTKQQEEAILIDYINSQNLWYLNLISEDKKIGEGAEQKVFYNSDKGTVFKINDSIFFRILGRLL